MNDIAESMADSIQRQAAMCAGIQVNTDKAEESIWVMSETFRRNIGFRDKGAGHSIRLLL